MCKESIGARNSVRESFFGIVAIFLANVYILQTFFSQTEKEVSMEDFISQKFLSGDKYTTKSNFTCLGKFFHLSLKHFFARIVAYFWLSGIEGEENIPEENDFLIVANHQSYFDFLLMILVFGKSKRPTFFVKSSYFDNFFWNFFFVQMGQIRADGKSIKKAMQILRLQKAPVILFPEGTRTTTGEIGELSGSLAIIARRMPSLKIIPVGISGAFKIWPAGQKFPRLGQKIKISIGKGFSFSDVGGGAEILAKTKNELTKLI